MARMVPVLRSYKTRDAEVEIFTSGAGDELGFIEHCNHQHWALSSSIVNPFRTFHTRIASPIHAQVCRLIGSLDFLLLWSRCLGHILYRNNIRSLLRCYGLCCTVDNFTVLNGSLDQPVIFSFAEEALFDASTTQIIIIVIASATMPESVGDVCIAFVAANAIQPSNGRRLGFDPTVFETTYRQARKFRDQILARSEALWYGSFGPGTGCRRAYTAFLTAHEQTSFVLLLE